MTNTQSAYSKICRKCNTAFMPNQYAPMKIQISFCMTLNFTWKRKHGGPIMTILKVAHVVEFVGAEKDSLYVKRNQRHVILA